MVLALPILGAFALGLAARRAGQRHFALAFRLNTGAGLAVLAFLAGWSFHGGAAGLGVLALILVAQVTAVVGGARLFRQHPDVPLLSFALWGNPGFWTVPVTAALFGSRAAVVMAAYDMLTQPRIAAAIRFMRVRAPIPQSARTGLVDYAPTACAVAGLGLGQLVTAPDAVPEVVVVLSTTMAVLSAILLGLGWPRGGWLRAPDTGLVVRLLVLHLTVLPTVLLAAALAGLAVPAGAWVLALGPLPVSAVMFARLYGYSARFAALALATSLAVALALLPVAVWLGQRVPI